MAGHARDVQQGPMMGTWTRGTWTGPPGSTMRGELPEAVEE
jgi:hypothetical protein